MKNLPFIQELTEARLFYGPKDVKGMSAQEIAELLYLLIMLLEVIRCTDENVAANYAAKTMELSPYDTMFYSGTDFGNLLAVLNHQDVFAGQIKVDGKISLPLFQSNRYLSAVRSKSKSSERDDQTFFWRLEEYFKVYSNSVFRKLRRDVGIFYKLTYADKVQILNLLRREFDNRGSQCDLYLWFKQSFRLKESRVHFDNNIVTEDIDINFEYHKDLNPKLWDQNNELHSDVKEALGKIANKFSEFIDIKQMKIVDYIITGSNCAFNYTDNSDIDLHVVVDTSKLGDNPLTAPFLLAKKSLWNSGHDITVKGYTVELYAEDVNKKEDALVATGIYSLLHDKWIKHPKYKKVTIDDSAVQKKVKDIIAQIDDVIDNNGSDEQIANLWSHLTKMRRAGLEKIGEFSVENIAYKAVRNTGKFDELRDYERKSEDEDLTLEQVSESSIEKSSRLTFDVIGDWSTRVFFTAHLKDEFKTWLDPKDKKVECGTATVDLDPSSNSAYINRMDVFPTGKGYGTELLTEIIKQIKVHGFSKITGYVEHGNAESKNMGQKYGFKEIERRKEGSIWEL